MKVSGSRGEDAQTALERIRCGRVTTLQTHIHLEPNTLRTRQNSAVEIKLKPARATITASHTTHQAEAIQSRCIVV